MASDTSKVSHVNYDHHDDWSYVVGNGEHSGNDGALLMFIIISNIHITTITNFFTIEDDADDDDDDGYGEPRRRIHNLQI